MPDRPKIPYELPNTLPGEHYHLHGEAKRWTRKLSEAGKLTSPGRRIPFYGPPRYRRINEDDQPQ